MARDRKLVKGVKVNAGATVPAFTRITQADARIIDMLANKEGITRGLWLRRLIERAVARERKVMEIERATGAKTEDGQ